MCSLLVISLLKSSKIGIKIIFVLSHCQNNIERVFSENKEIQQENQQEKSLISQWLIYDS